MEEKTFIFCFLTLGKFTPPFGTCECLNKSSELQRNVMLHEELKEKKVQDISLLLLTLPWLNYFFRVTWLARSRTWAPGGVLAACSHPTFSPPSGPMAASWQGCPGTRRQQLARCWTSGWGLWLAWSLPSCAVCFLTPGALRFKPCRWST